MRLLRQTKKDRTRPVKRVLVMLDYGPDDPCSGEVFDVTALALELADQDVKHHHSCIKLEITAREDYSKNRVDGKRPLQTTLEWCVMQSFESSGGTGWLDDAVNASLPITERNEAVMKRIRQAESKVEKLRELLKCQRLEQAEQMRAHYPIARITETPMKALGQAGHDES